MSIHAERRRSRQPQTRTRLDALSYASRIYEALDTPVSLGMFLRIRYKCWDELARASVDPNNYRDPVSYFLDAQAVSLLAKYPDLKTSFKTRHVAAKKFIEAEVQCLHTNERFRQSELCGFKPHVERTLSRARRKIALILGAVPEYETLDFRFGPGAAYGVRGETSYYNKLVADLECTHALQPHLTDFLSEFPGWLAEGLATVELVAGSELTFVPKNAKTDRAICIEPLLNGLMQKGIGSYIRNRLLKFGINLQDQGVNQRLAKAAFAENLATVDFSSASDTIAYNLVLDLLPIDWFEFLDRSRCANFKFENSWYPFQKFSSMGNAYTFELESLIFYALACAVCEEEGIEYMTGSTLSVYGDDVIIPQEAYPSFTEISAVCGFTVNLSKSFARGLFFESCGEDYFLGYNTRPFFVKTKLETITDAFYAHNITKRLQSRLAALGNSSVCDRLDRVCQWVVGTVPIARRAFGPEGYGDGHFVADLDSVCPARHRDSSGSQWCGWVYRTYRETAIVVERDEWPLSYALYTAGSGCRVNVLFGPEPESSSHKGDGYSIRNRTRVRPAKGFAPVWPTINWRMHLRTTRLTIEWPRTMHCTAS